jgi:hypothetical protein
MKYQLGLSLSLSWLLLTVSACDSPTALLIQQSTANPLKVRANFQAASSALQASTLTILETDKLPPDLNAASLIEVVFDTTKTRIPATRNSDGSLTFPYRSSLPIAGDGSLSVILVGDRTLSYPVQLETGTELAFNSPAILISPAQTVTQGGRLNLKANFKQADAANQYDFTWSYATSAAGPWQAISGNTSEISWDASRVGNYYLRLEMRNRQTLSVSSYTTPSALIRIQDSDRLALTTPSSGTVLEGERIGLEANLPEYDKSENLRYLWSYSPSLQGSFSPISDEGKNISWETPRAGSYYLRLQVLSENGNATYTSSKTLVQVGQADSVIQTTPTTGSIVRGEAVALQTTLSDSADLSYTWFYGFSPQGSFTSIPGSGKGINWTPNLTGDFYLRLRTFDAKSGQSRTYTSSKTLVTVRDSDAVFGLSPLPASLLKGDSVQLTLNQADTENVIWSYASTAQGPFLPIPATGKSVSWTPAASGSFYLKAESPRSDGSLATWVSANSLVTVADRGDAIKTEPALGQLQLGQSVKLNSSVKLANGRYSWSYASSASGPFLPVPSLESDSLSTVTWYPTQSGSYFIKLDISDPQSRSSVSFVSEQALVQIQENKPFFTTDPNSGRVKSTENVLIKAQFDSGNRAFNYGWAYAKGAAGPYTPMGGSTLPEFFWNLANKPQGSYYVRFTATPPGSDRSLNYFSQVPLLFVTTSDSASPEFGVSSIF